MKVLLGLDTDELCALVQEAGGPAYRGKQIAEWVYQRGVRTFEQMTNLPDSLRAHLSKEYEVGRSETVAVQRSRDGTIKLLLELADGSFDKLRMSGGNGLRMSGEEKLKTKDQKLKFHPHLNPLPSRERRLLLKIEAEGQKFKSMVETVGLPYADRFSCCLSTQVGCPVGCVFCATGLGGYSRNLTAGEIVDQVLAVQEAAQTRVDHVVFMGMGEPLLNYEATVKAVRLLNSELGIAMRHLTVSTVGFVPGIRRLAQEKLQVTLAVSLHAPTDDLRRQLIPGMKWSLAEIIDACREYLQQTGRRVTFEYCLLDGVNDGAKEAQELARLLRGMNCHVNLIPYNPVPGLSLYKRPRKSIRAFREILEGAGIRVTQRVQRGPDIDAACGQLKAKN
ncbi:MAG: 23S rRNA (adenine(2503)-C(2))-methyltransferase RlmN [Dehalococcoidia bacterium]|nr:23S rRNA (adenine(2503)-C(2))-methyltransferase RlmN [Dehalococcoidia bacterium]